MRLISRTSDIIYLLLICYSIVTVNSSRTSSNSQRNNTQSSGISNRWTGSLTSTPLLDPISLEELENHKRDSSNAVAGALIRGQASHNATESSTRGTRRRDEIPSTDCFGKRRDILRKQHLLDPKHYQVSSTTPSPSGYHRLKPKRDRQPTSSANESFVGLYNEHLPQCNQNGMYEPVQCHKIGYCWCVNKFGQAIKNSAAIAGEKPSCDLTLYESDSNDLVVVTGASANRIKNLLKVGSATSESPAPNKIAGNVVDSLENDDRQPSKEHESDFDRRVSASQEPSLALVPNDCSLSRQKAMERAARHTDDSIWIPGCDHDNHNLYAERQCHKLKVCWCVDQVSGLPLRASEQLTKEISINCTEIKRIVGILENRVKQDIPKRPPSFVQGFSESCDADKRSELVALLINQFRQQLSEYVRFNPTSKPPEGVTSMNPYKLNESQVSKWRFAIMDVNSDGKLDDREWSKFKVNFKLLDKVDIDSYHSYNQLSNTQSFLTPLSIIRSQRRCWRDFLQFCGNGDVLTNESISLSKWLLCTDLPSRSILPSDQIGDKSNSDGVPDAYTRAAAIARSKKRNPFLGILKPD